MERQRPGVISLWTERLPAPASFWLCQASGIKFVPSQISGSICCQAIGYFSGLTTNFWAKYWGEQEQKAWWGKKQITQSCHHMKKRKKRKKEKKRKKKNRSYLSEAAQTAEAFLQQAQYTEKQILHIVTLIIMSIIFKSYFFKTSLPSLLWLIQPKTNHHLYLIKQIGKSFPLVWRSKFSNIIYPPKWGQLTTWTKWMTRFSFPFLAFLIPRIPKEYSKRKTPGFTRVKLWKSDSKSMRHYFQTRTGHHGDSLGCTGVVRLSHH